MKMTCVLLLLAALVVQPVPAAIAGGGLEIVEVTPGRPAPAPAGGVLLGPLAALLIAVLIYRLLRSGRA